MECYLKQSVTIVTLSFLSLSCFWPCRTACRILVPQHFSCPLQWRHGVLTTGPPGNSLISVSLIPVQQHRVHSLFLSLDWYLTSLTVRTLLLSSLVLYLFNQSCPSSLRCIPPPPPLHRSLFTTSAPGPDPPATPAGRPPHLPQPPTPRARPPPHCRQAFPYRAIMSRP